MLYVGIRMAALTAIQERLDKNHMARVQGRVDSAFFAAPALRLTAPQGCNAGARAHLCLSLHAATNPCMQMLE
eukprot:6160056-Pleurochrysis_carterae.AAC.1